MDLQQHQRFCEECGAPLPEGLRFCLQCGAAVGGEVISEPAVPSSTKRSGIGLALALACAVALLAAAGAWWWMKRDAALETVEAEKPVTEAKVQPPPSLPEPPPPASEPAAPVPVPSSPTKPQDPEIAAAQDLAEMVLWLGKEPWVLALKKSMPKGVTVSFHADPYDAEGWSDVQFREHHAPESGFDPDVSPSVGIFRISRNDRTVQWMEPVSGDYVPLREFIKSREMSQRPEPSSDLGFRGGDFESKPAVVANHDEAVIVTDPTNAANHVARIIGPDEMSFALPLRLPAGAAEASLSLRLLIPHETKIVPFDDGTAPEGIRLRVRLINQMGNSTIRDMVVRPTGAWRKLQFTFYDLPAKVVAFSVEAIWMQGPVYVDDVTVQWP